VAIEFRPQCREQGPVLFVDRAAAAEVLVVLGHLQHALARYVAAAENVLEEREHVVGAVRTAEGNEEHRAVGRGLVLAHGSRGFVGKCGHDEGNPDGTRSA